MKIIVLLSNGFEELEMTAPVDLCRRAGIQVDIYALQEGPITSAHGLVYCDFMHYKDIDLTQYDALLIPGGGHYKELEATNEVLDTIRFFYDTGKFIFTICAAPTILGRMGLLKNRKYTCFTSMNEDFGGTYIDDHAVVDLPFITAKSAASCFEFSFAIIRLLLGESKVQEIKQEIYF